MASVRATNAVTAVYLRELTPNSIKFNDILHHFCTTWAKGRCPNVDHIFEIDNARLKFRWDSFKQSMGSPVTVEQCYYGNTLQCDLASTMCLCNNEGCYICRISQGGFGATTTSSRSGCRYFLAPNSSKSNEYTQKSYALHRYRTILLCDVLPGKKYTVCASPTRVPAPPPGYDSVYLTPGSNLKDPLIGLCAEASIFPHYIIVYGRYMYKKVYLSEGPNMHQSQESLGGPEKKWTPSSDIIGDGSCEDQDQSRRLYDEAMKKGYVETSVIKCLILGAAGVGKTHLKHLLLKKDPPKLRISTGLADNPVRAMSYSLAGVDTNEDDWFVVDDDQALMRIVGETIKGGGICMASSLSDMVSTLPKMAIITPDDGVSVGHSDPILPDVKSAVLEDELIHHINNSSANKKLLGVKWIQFIDSGGQLQYHDLLPLFVQHSAVTIFVLKLSEELSHHPIIEYYGEDGKPVGKPHPSCLSHKQILQYYLGAILSQDACPLIITVGTHRDATCASNESMEEKDQQVQELLTSTSCNQLYTGEDMKGVIFAVNGKDPQDEDRHVAQELRKKIVSSLSSESMKMPIAWFGLEVTLQQSSENGILSLTQCQEHAKRFHIEGDAFSAALHHLVKHNVFLYYPEVLPQTVFCDPQVVLTKVTELVEYNHKLRNNPDVGVAVTGDLIMFRDRGLLSVELLRKFAKHYKEGLFTPQDLVKLLVSRGAIAMIKDGKYLMPALLPHLDSTEVSKYLERGASLMIRFTRGYIPSGLFCCLVAHLLSPTNTSPWKVCMEGDKPLCLYRNCVSFEQRGTAEIVTLVDMFSYIVLHVDEASSDVYREIRDHVHSGIKSACNVLKYHNVQLEDAFMCAGARCISDPPHLAVVCSLPSGSVYKWKCTRSTQRGEVSENQLMWLSSVMKRCSSTSGEAAQGSLFSQQQSSSVSPQQMCESLTAVQKQAITTTPVLPTLELLLHFTGKTRTFNVAIEVASAYSKMGVFLLKDQTGAVVQALQKEHMKDAEMINMAIFSQWLQGKGAQPVTWSTLIGVLRKIGLCVLADDIEGGLSDEM